MIPKEKCTILSNFFDYQAHKALHNTELHILKIKIRVNK